MTPELNANGQNPVLEFPDKVTAMFVARDGTLIVTVEGGHRYRVWRSKGKFHQKRLS